MARKCCTHTQRSAHHPEEFKADLLKRLNRIAGQVRGIQSMIAEDIYCDDVLTQVSAVRSALSAVAGRLFEAHTRTCIREQIQSGQADVMDELLLTIRRMMK